VLKLNKRRILHSWLSGCACETDVIFPINPETQRDAYQRMGVFFVVVIVPFDFVMDE
jgi:hypothetical protein